MSFHGHLQVCTSRMSIPRVPISTLMLLAVLSVMASVLPETIAQEADKPPAVSFHKDVRPILQRHCSGCHQPAKAGGELKLTTFADITKGGAGGTAIVPGKADDSLLVQYVAGDPPEMPLNAAPLSAKQIATIRDWINQGAHDDTPAAAAVAYTESNPPRYSSPPVITALAYSPDSRFLAVSGHNEILLHHADGSGLAGRLIGRSPKINSLDFSPDGKILAATGGAPAQFGEVQFWQVETRQLQAALPLSIDTLFGGSFSNDGTQFACGGFDNKARVVEVATGKVLMTLDAHSDLVFDTTFSLKQDHLITVSRDMSMKLTEIKTAQFIDNITSITPGALKGGLMAVQRHPTEEQVLCGGADGEPKLYKIFRTQARQIGDDFNKLRAYPALPGRVVALQFSPDGQKFVAGSSNATSGAARIYNTADGQVLHELKGHPAGVFAVAFRPDQQQVATGGFDGKIRLFDVPTGQLVKEFVPVELTTDVVARP